MRSAARNRAKRAPGLSGWERSFHVVESVLSVGLREIANRVGRLGQLGPSPPTRVIRVRMLFKIGRPAVVVSCRFLRGLLAHWSWGQPQPGDDAHRYFRA